MRPHQPTFYPHHQVPPAEVPTRIILCLMIAVATASFFWIYDTTQHHDVPYVPSLYAGSSHGLRGNAPQPDMDSAAVVFSNADVQPVRSQPPIQPGQRTVQSQVVGALKQISAQAANAYASGASLLKQEPNTREPDAAPAAHSAYAPRTYGAPD